MAKEKAEQPHMDAPKHIRPETCQKVIGPRVLCEGDYIRMLEELKSKEAELDKREAWITGVAWFVCLSIAIAAVHL